MRTPLILQYEVSGEGRPLILVPGGLTGWKSWEPYVSYFTGLQRKVIRVQLLSVQYGLEDRPLPEDYSVKTESRALREVISALNLNAPADIIGWSFGAFISLDFALDNPEAIATLTLIEPPAFWVLLEKGELDVQTREIMHFFRTLKGNITDEMLSGFLEKAGFTQVGESPLNLPQWPQWLPYKKSLRNSRAIVNHTDDLKRLRNFKSPVLLVKGTGSAPFLHAIIDELEYDLPDARLIEMPEGHAPHIVSRDTFLQAWNKFQEDYRTELVGKADHR